MNGAGMGLAARRLGRTRFPAMTIVTVVAPGRSSKKPRGVMGERFDAIVIGMGPGGEVAAARLLEAGRRVAVIEAELIGGECAYWACMP
jgi:hypothetical protein